MPAWLVRASSIEIDQVEEVPDGDIMWEDHVQYHGDRAGWVPKYLAHSGWLIRQILAGQSAAPTPTHCLVVATRRTEAGQIPFDIDPNSREQT